MAAAADTYSSPEAQESVTAFASPALVMPRPNHSHHATGQEGSQRSAEGSESLAPLGLPTRLREGRSLVTPTVPGVQGPAVSCRRKATSN